MLRRYLLEIGMEEFPAGYVKNAKRQAVDTMAKMLSEQEIPYEKIEMETTPRRFALWFYGLPEHTAEKSLEAKGPAVKIAFDGSGNPAKPLEGFLRAQGATAEDISIRALKGVEYVFVNKKIPGRPVEEILTQELPGVIKSWVFPKSMRWGGKNFRFARPVRWIVSLMEAEVLPFDLEGIPVGRLSYGHRFLGKNPISIHSVDSYEAQLEENYVIVNEKRREDLIWAQSRKLVRGIGGELLSDEDLLDEIVHIVEYPTALLGNIRPEYLKLPKEVIITPMKDHQRYFPVVDDKGRLLPYFVTVRNGDAKGLEIVRKGNEKVLAPRLEDAKFFYEEDLKSSLAEKVDALHKVAFHEKLGSMYEKSLRLEALCSRLGEALDVGEETLENVRRAAHLSKADLTTRMVTEFTELEGTMGRIYAEASGENPIVAKSIEEQYYPRRAGGKLPTMTCGKILSVADKLDSIAGMTAIGLKTTGSQDPFGLRRNAIGILRILKESKLEIDLSSMVRDALYIYLQNNRMVFDYEDVHQKVLHFIRGRFENLLESEGYRYDLIDAVLAVRPEAIFDASLRLEALTDVVENPDFEECLTVIGRMTSFAEKAEDDTVDKALLVSDEEKAMGDLDEQKARLDRLLDMADYKEAMAVLSSMAPVINRYLDHTMIIVEDENLRRNRLALISDIYRRVLRFFDPALIRKG